MSAELEQAQDSYKAARIAEWRAFLKSGTPDMKLAWQRFAAKGILAHLVSKNPDDDGTKRLQYALHSPRRHRGYTLAEFAFMKEETPAVLSPGRREPTIEEAILATERLTRTEDAVIGYLDGFTQGLIQVGSLSWAQNFWINHPNAKSRPSDIDVEAVVTPDQLNGLPNNPLFQNNTEFISGLTVFQSLYENGIAHYFTFRPILDGISVSMHFVPQEVFHSICGFDYAGTNQTQILYEYRTSGRSSGYTYHQRGFDGMPHKYISTPLIDSEHGVVFPVPLTIVDGGHMGLGYPADKYLSASRTFLDPEGVISDEISVMRASVAHRLACERDEFGMPDMTLGKAFSRGDRMNPETVGIMNAEVESILQAE